MNSDSENNASQRNPQPDANGSGVYQGGFIMFNRSPEADELLADPLAFVLLAQIARRARWRITFSRDGLEIGEALIGDHKSLGMTRAEYRKRLDRLEEWGQIATRKTNKGTVAKLVSSLVFDINGETGIEKNNQQERQRITGTSPANRQQITNGSPLTNKGIREEGKNGTKENVVDERHAAAIAIASTIADLEELKEGLRKLYPKHNLGAEWKSYSKFRDKRELPKTGTTFVEWMEKAQLRIVTKSKRVGIEPIIESAIQAPDDNVTPEESKKLRSEFQTLMGRPLVSRI